MPVTGPVEKVTGQEDGAISACLNARKEFMAHTERLAGAIEAVRLTLASRRVLLELMEAYQDAAAGRAQQIADVCVMLRTPR